MKRSFLDYIGLDRVYELILRRIEPKIHVIIQELLKKINIIIIIKNPGDKILRVKEISTDVEEIWSKQSIEVTINLEPEEDE